MKPLSLISLIILCFVSTGYSQPNLAVNDIVVLQVNSDGGSDELALLALADIPENEIFYISDISWNAIGSTYGSSTERGIKLTVASGGFSAGTIIRIDNPTGALYELEDSGLGTLEYYEVSGVVETGSSRELVLSTSGDQVIIFQTTDGVITSTKTFIYGFSFYNSGTSDGWQASGTPLISTSGDSHLPPGLTALNSAQSNKTSACAIGMGGLVGHVDNWQYTGPVTSGDKNEWLTRVHTLSNWSSNNTTVYSNNNIASGGNVTVTSSDPATSTFSGTGNWATAARWDNGVPGSTTDVTIASNANCTIGSDVSAKSVIISETSAVTIDASKTLTVTNPVVIYSDASNTGSLIVDGDLTGTVSINRYLSQDLWHYVSSPISGQSIDATFMTANSIYSPNGGTNYNFYRWDEDQNYWIIYGSTGDPEAFSDTEFGAAKGYALTTSASGDLTFTGSIRTSDVSYAATLTSEEGDGYNVVGNPFTSSIGINSSASSTTNFLTENTSLLDDSFEAIYVWDEQAAYAGNRDDYKIIGVSSFGSYSVLSQNYVNSGQAFMIKVASAGNITFKESMQSHQNSITSYKSTEDQWPYVELIVQNETLFNSTAIGFNESMTKGLDPSYDVAKMKGNPNISLYSKLVNDNGEDFALQALSDSNIEDYKIPIGVDISESSTIEFIAIKNKLENYHIILEDIQENKLTDLGKVNYITEVNESGAGRFFLIFKNAVSIQESAERSNIRLWNYRKTISIANPDNEKGILNITNISGQIIETVKLTEDAKQEIQASINPGIYIISVETDKSLIRKKIYIN